MRVISGSCKGRRLRAVPGQNTRPTTDKVKETMFNIIGPFFEEGFVLDLYGGSGGLGIEALSRGMQKGVFVDHYGPAIETIKANLELCDLQDQAEVFRNDAYRALKALEKREMAFDLIFLDPPYAKEQLMRDIAKISEGHLLKSGGFLVVEHADEVDLPDKLSDSIHRFRYQTFNEQTALSFYSKS
ncbi:16S rRNA (guanine(966)-N(2))-methyltransferase RsmD [Pullulanibacillus sp. KACC 23026]|uniref:16S rRNA (guanine(966)-N(2))-methyltransferase RsmD n=1 Tax=Pullulanibacillus sp. KACC 23026 TaxID=3028315 RepID=UPI0023B0CE96|nr:16S rRNA (guanine(966)-N(2))-methyltransferase RsmD [Pullulanibacillus sp. KACC 23026]WEG11685.1 16S rRNA (guanine(966)-N(2))-methyltransferase RsmD [Pullulanibacillus sp. KACC 23026]